MVFFKDISFASGVQHLMILDDENQSIEKGTSLTIYDPLIGRLAKPRPRLTNSYHMDEWSREIPFSKTSKVWALQSTHHQQVNEPTQLSTLGHRIIEGKAKWGDTIQFAGEFHYIKGYWEWTEDILSRCENKLFAAQVYDPVYASLFTYDRNLEVVKAFCEAWCPSTNTLLTSYGELSISLWDLHTLAGLPLSGSFYDEVVPSAMELTGIDEAGGRYVPRSCSHLFHAYHLLRGSANGDQFSQVPVEAWINFWSKKAVKYHQPPLRREKKAARPKSTHNPLGDFGLHEEWSSAEISLFSKLGVKENARDEIHLAAFLACWLCAFVFPNDGINFIRPSTFKMASIMANGRKVDLAIPVLASIYKGLNKIANSPRPSRVYSTFPIHFVYGWLAHYFKTHYRVWQGVRGPKMAIFSGEGSARFYDPKEARKRIHKGEFASWTCTMITKTKDFSYVDNGNAEEFEQNYFIAIRSSYLSLRQGGNFTIEPYSPHRFSRQFGFYQVLPGVLKHDVRKASLEEGVRYWRLCTLSKTMSKARLPCMPPSAKKFSSEEYKKWWLKVHGNYFEENLARLINLKPCKVLPKDQEHVNGDGLLDESTQGLPHIISLPKNCEAPSIEPLRANKRSVSRSLEESNSSNVDRHWKRPKKNIDTSQVEDFVGELERDLLNIDDDEESQCSQKSIVGLNSPTPPSSIDKTMQNKTSNSNKAEQKPQCAAFSVFEGAKFVLNHQKEFLRKLWNDLRKRIAGTSIDSISSIKDDISLVLQSMKSFNGFDVSHLEEILEALFVKAAAYDEARSTSSEKASKELLARQLSEANDRLRDAKTKESKEASQIQSTKDELGRVKKKFDGLKKQKKDLSASLKRQQQLLQSSQNKVHGIEEEITAIENASPMNDEVIENLKTSKLLLESAKEELKDLNPFA